MPSLCQYGMCHNLGARRWDGYCDQYHYERGLAIEKKIAEDAKISPQDKNPKLLYCREEFIQIISQMTTKPSASTSSASGSVPVDNHKSSCEAKPSSS